MARGISEPFARRVVRSVQTTERERRRPFVPFGPRMIPQGGGSASAAPQWYQILTDQDSDICYVSYANPGGLVTAGTGAGFLADSHAGASAPIDPAWTVLALDGSGQCPSWTGDWVQAVPVSIVLEGYENYNVVLITQRISAQLTFWGQLGMYALPSFGQTVGFLAINSQEPVKMLTDGGLLYPGTSLEGESFVEATYHPNLRLYLVNASPCQGADS